MTKEINLLAINSFELEQYLTDIGLSLLSFGREYNFSEKSMGVKDCDFLQCCIIEFTSEIKTDFIAYYGVSLPGLRQGDAVSIIAKNLSWEVELEAIVNARERKLTLISPRFGFKSRLKWQSQQAWKILKKRLYNIRSQYLRSKIKESAFPKPHADQFRLLMSTYNRNTIFTLTPIQDILKSRTDVVQCYIANRIETYKLLKGLGYPGIIYGWSTPSDGQISLNDEVFDDFIDQYFRERFPFGEATSYFKKRFKSKLKMKLLFLASLYSPMVRVLEDFKPHVLLLSSCSTSDGQLLIHLTAARNIRTIEMTHGMFQDTPLLQFQNVPVKMVWCERQRDVMKKYRPEIVCPVIGNPKHDDLLRKFESSPPKNNWERPYILFATTPGNNISISWVTYVKILKDYIAAAKEFPEMDFVVKLHPSEDLVAVQREADLAGAPSNLKIRKDVNVYELIFYAKMVMVVTSTVGFEALLWNKKLICYTIPNSDKWLPFVEYKLAKSATSAGELVECVQFFKQNESLTINNAYRDYFAFSDGKALDKILSYTLDKIPA